MIIIDTNMFLAVGSLKIDIIDKCKDFDTKLGTTKSVINELKILSKGHGKDAANARISLELIKKNNIDVLSSEGKTTDEKILNIAKKNKYIVATNDEELIKKLKNNNLKVLRIRQNKYLVQI